MGLIDSLEINILPWCVKLDIATNNSTKLNQFQDDKGRIDLGDPQALSEYNKAVAKTIANVDIELPDGFLIPTVCLRQAYLVILIDEILQPGSTILEIGTGASAILSLLAASIHQLEVVATEINELSYKSALTNIRNNNLEDKITLLKSEGGIIDGVVDKSDKYDALICYPPTYPDKDSSTYDDKGTDLGFRGTKSEMIGGGKTGFAFIHQMISEAMSFEIVYITVLLIFEEHVNPTVTLLNTNNFQTKEITLLAGTRKRYLVIAKENTF